MGTQGKQGTAGVLAEPGEMEEAVFLVSDKVACLVGEEVVEALSEETAEVSRTIWRARGSNGWHSIGWWWWKCWK